MLPIISFNSNLSFKNNIAQKLAKTVCPNKAMATLVDGKKRMLWLMVIQPVNWQINPMPKRHNHVFIEKLNRLLF